MVVVLECGCMGVVLGEEEDGYSILLLFDCNAPDSPFIPTIANRNEAYRGASSEEIDKLFLAYEHQAADAHKYQRALKLLKTALDDMS